VAGIGHCGDCHTPRNGLAGEKGEALAGGTAEGWRAPALNANSPAPVPWDADHLFTYLRQGWDDRHGAAAGPMQAVVDELSRASEADVRAIAVYLASLQTPVSDERRKHAEKALAHAAAPQDALTTSPGEQLGAAIFAGACASCHTGGAAMVPPRGIDLALSSALNEPDPRNAIGIVLDGIHPRSETAGPLMPAFKGTLNDTQVAALLQYLRVHYGPGPAWPNLEAAVRASRQDRDGS
jgi:mono/diheme cytochrome c family protein